MVSIFTLFCELLDIIEQILALFALPAVKPLILRYAEDAICEHAVQSIIFGFNHRFVFEGDWNAASSD